MPEKKASRGSFIIHSFMIRLDLTASELLVYALIYSYTRSGDGFFWGSLDYAAEQTGVARRTVNGAVRKLLALGLIDRCEQDGRRGLYAVGERKSETERTEAEIPIVKDKTQSEISVEKEPRENKTVEKPTEKEEKEWEKAIAMPEEHEKRRVVPGRFLFPDVNTGKLYLDEPKYSYITVGKDKVVKMTVEQYDKIKSLIPDIDLKRYIEKLASIHIERSALSERWAKTDYRILRSWIDEDYKA